MSDLQGYGMGEEMNEHPILFSSEMVRAILDGTKTQTRRVIQGVDWADKFIAKWIMSKALFTDSILNRVSNKPHDFLVKCPYGLEGDSLWVRETWQAESEYDGVPPSYIPKDSNLRWIADDSISIKGLGSPFGRVRQSIHMPRWASRITLEIVNIRVERLQKITAADAFAEGVRTDYLHQPPDWMDIDRYKELWDSINAKRGYGWDVNPWVWVIEFKVAS